MRCNSFHEHKLHVITSPSTLLRVVSLSNQSPKGATKQSQGQRLLRSLWLLTTLELPIELSDEDSSVALIFD